jgi:hypothetical protein
MIALVEPEIACSVLIAFSKAPRVRMSVADVPLHQLDYLTSRRLGEMRSA